MDIDVPTPALPALPASQDDDASNAVSRLSLEADADVSVHARIGGRLLSPVVSASALTVSAPSDFSFVPPTVLASSSSSQPRRMGQFGTLNAVGEEDEGAASDSSSIDHTLLTGPAPLPSLRFTVPSSEGNRSSLLTDEDLVIADTGASTPEVNVLAPSLKPSSARGKCRGGAARFTAKGRQAAPEGVALDQPSMLFIVFRLFYLFSYRHCFSSRAPQQSPSKQQVSFFVRPGTPPRRFADAKKDSQRH